jgi:hypothetical protein
VKSLTGEALVVRLDFDERLENLPNPLLRRLFEKTPINLHRPGLALVGLGQILPMAGGAFTGFVEFFRFGHIKDSGDDGGVLGLDLGEGGKESRPLLGVCDLGGAPVEGAVADFQFQNALQILPALPGEDSDRSRPVFGGRNDMTLVGAAEGALGRSGRTEIGIASDAASVDVHGQSSDDSEVEHSKGIRSCQQRAKP